VIRALLSALDAMGTGRCNGWYAGCTRSIDRHARWRQPVVESARMAR